MGLLACLVKHVLNQIDDVFRALADPTRRSIVEQLAVRDEAVSELARPLTMSLPAVLQHLAVLEASGLVRSRKTGRVRTCSLDRAVFDRAEKWFVERRLAWNDRLDRLGDYLADEHE
ncbi:metalloregulator ArsR/SmtB family transcription factor [Humibacter ginsengiterrae]